jgi:serine/threonine protein kinase/Tol biopolymer transport system component
MTLQSGARLGPYEIVDRLGAGGMGEVFRARDTRLERTVAVKTLPAELAHNAQFRLRFQREAKAISALSHPNICALYDVGEHEGVDYLVMEYLEGETLAERLARGPLPLKEALRVGVEIAGALERAHREGIIHRDLKPGNVMLTRGGAKLLDFGLAKSGASPVVSVDAATMQHKDAPLTAEGSIVGTFQYMAPEQLEGAGMDARSDIFAFGALLYEMITGSRAFNGKTRTSLIASIVASTPRAMSEIAPVTPPELEHVVQRCLEKDPEARWQSAHDVRLELEWIARHLGDVPKKARPLLRVAPWLVAAASVAAAIFFGLRAMRTSDPPPLKAHIVVAKGQRLVSMDSLSISPDGRYVTYRVQGEPHLVVRAMDSTEARPIPGTEGGGFPFWSPDSRWIAFFSQGKLRKVSLNGAPPIALCDVSDGRSGAWSDDGVILFAPSPTSSLHRVSAAGGNAQVLTTLDAKQKETTHRWPVFLPGGDRFLFFAGTHKDTVGGESNAVYLSSLAHPGQRSLIVRARSNVMYSRGHLLYVKDQVLVAQPFDARRGVLSGEPFRVAENIAYDADFFRAAFSATPDGTLVYHTSKSPPDATLQWRTPSAIAGNPIGAARPYRTVALSPDAKRAAAVVTDRKTGLTDLWVIDLADGSESCLTPTPEMAETTPVWSPDGQQIVFSRGQGFTTGGDLHVISADGSGNDRLLARSPHDTHVFAWSPDGKFILFGASAKGGVRTEKVLMVPAAGGPVRDFVDGPGDDYAASFSPDGKWVAFINELGATTRVYATPFPGGGSRVLILSQTGRAARWLRDGISLRGPQGVFHIPVTIQGDRPVPGVPRKIMEPFRVQAAVAGDVASADRFLMAVREDDAFDDTITLSTNWLPRYP